MFQRALPQFCQNVFRDGYVLGGVELLVLKTGGSEEVVNPSKTEDSQVITSDSARVLHEHLGTIH